MFKKDPGKVKGISLRDARLAITEQREYWDMRYRNGDIFLDYVMEPTMECIDEILFQLDKLESMGHSSDKEGVEEFMRQRWMNSRSHKPVHGKERGSWAPSVTGRKPTPWPPPED